MIHFEDHSSDKPSDNPVAYLKEMLQLNPVLQSGEIIRRRRQWRNTNFATTADASNTKPPSFSQRHRTATESLSSDDLERLRERAWRYLDRLHKQFYSLPEETLNRYITLLHHAQIPEFAERAERFRQVARHRNAILEFSLNTNDQPFAEALQKALIAPVSVAGQIWERYIDSMISAKRVNQRARRVRKFVDQYPAIYQLDQAWFDELLNRRNQRDWERSYSFTTRVRNLIGNRTFQVIVFLITAVIMIAARATDLDNSRSRSPSRRSIQPPRFKLNIPKAEDLPRTNLPTTTIPSTVFDPLSPDKATGQKPPDPVNEFLLKRTWSTDVIDQMQTLSPSRLLPEIAGPEAKMPPPPELPEAIDPMLPSRELRKSIERILQSRRSLQQDLVPRRNNDPQPIVEPSADSTSSSGSDQDLSESGATDVSN
ncbi:hypothetical protein U8335_22090 [Roseiconus lacunae]|uniref:hypothetical protein n=1 Tax=Roseiconus lacunae TaxID=2605694 RepID=UPI00308A5B08|nr:hypothetical protein U8335_22090 [Stieleria sp. HD01]